ncbi:MAG: hypothetical protein WD398_04250 [Cyclobacteriaceae bacterium]
MKEKINTSLHGLSLAVFFSILAWYYVADGVTASYTFTVLIIALIVVEIVSLTLVSSLYPESHTSFKIGIIAAFFILLGIKSMLPIFFVPLTLALVAVNFLYNFYTTNKRRQGRFKRRKKSFRR